jgi:hypothetical protein
MRRLIDDDEFVRRMTELGVTERLEREYFWDLAHYQPTPTDLMRLMVRDVWDDRVVEKFRYDDEFSDKFRGSASDYFESVGVTRDTALLYWRAHWQIPSPGQAYEMLHRLRPGAVDKNLVTTAEDVYDLLGINDMMPYWRNRMMALSYAVPRLVDLRNSFLRGLTTEQQTHARMMDRGYNEKDATESIELLKTQQIDYWAGRREGKAYLSGAIGSTQLDRLLDRAGVHFLSRTRIVHELQERRAIEIRTRCTAQLKKRYLQGEYTQEQVLALMVRDGIDSGDALGVVGGWNCEKQARSKHIPAKQMCTLAERGLLTYRDMLTRLVAVGYSQRDALRVARACQLSAREKAIKVAESEARKREAAKEKQTKREQAERRAAAKAAAGADKARSRVASEQLRVERIMVSAAGVAAKFTGRTQDQERHLVERAVTEAVQRGGPSKLEAAQLVKAIIDVASKTDRADWFADWEQAKERIPPVSV